MKFPKIEIRRSNIPEFIDLTKQLLTLNTALVGGIFFKTGGNGVSMLIAGAAVCFTFAIALFFAFLAGLIEHKDAEVDESCESSTIARKPEYLLDRVALAFAAGFAVMMAGLMLLCVEFLL